MGPDNPRETSQKAIKFLKPLNSEHTRLLPKLWAEVYAEARNHERWVPLRAGTTSLSSSHTQLRNAQSAEPRRRGSRAGTAPPQAAPAARPAPRSRRPAPGSGPRQGREGVRALPRGGREEVPPDAHPELADWGPRGGAERRLTGTLLAPCPLEAIMRISLKSMLTAADRRGRAPGAEERCAPSRGPAVAERTGRPTPSHPASASPLPAPAAAVRPPRGPQRPGFFQGHRSAREPLA